MDAGQLGHVIARIYDAALNPDNWGNRGQLMSELRKETAKN